MRRPRLSDKAWLIPQKELSRFFKMITFLFGASDFSNDVKTLYLRVKKLIDKSGANFAFLYLKTSLHIIIMFLAGTPLANTTVLVKRDSLGLPTIIPRNLRSLIISKNNKGVQFVLSLISVFRVLKTRPKINLSTITSPFSGISRTIDMLFIERALKTLKYRRPHFGAYKLIKLETASPTGFKACWNSSSDLIALIHNPKQLYYMLRIWDFSHFFNIILFVWVIISIIILLPFSLVTYLVDGRLRLGKIGVVYEAAGKARLVGITNYWIQVVLRPLHDYLFKILRQIDEDGTFDQHLPLSKLVVNDDLYYSFDLSAATDRLPVQLQADILNKLLGNQYGTKWQNLLDFEWKTPNGKDFVKYSVGQPMGAYSSWAMLALSHHVIVRHAMNKCFQNSSNLYAILGDDIVIKNHDISLEYRDIMRSLGVSINMSKSVISKDFAEFAKVYRGPNVEYTPIGPGLILRLIRDNCYLGNVLYELMKLKIISSYGACLKILQSLPRELLPAKAIGLWSVFGLKGTMWKITARDVSYLEKSIAYLLSSSTSYSIMTKYLVFNAVRQAKLDMMSENMSKLLKEFKLLFWKADSMTSNSWSLRFSEIATRLITPGFWVYFYAFVKDYFTLRRDMIYLLDYNNFKGDLLEATEIMEDSVSVVSIDWSKKNEIKKMNSFFDNVYKIISRIKYVNDTGVINTDSLVMERPIEYYEILIGELRRNARKKITNYLFGFQWVFSVTGLARLVYRLNVKLNLCFSYINTSWRSLSDCFHIWSNYALSSLILLSYYLKIIFNRTNLIGFCFAFVIPSFTYYLCRNLPLFWWRKSIRISAYDCYTEKHTQILEFRTVLDDLIDISEELSSRHPSTTSPFFYYLLSLSFIIISWSFYIGIKRFNESHNYDSFNHLLNSIEPIAREHRVLRQLIRDDYVFFNDFIQSENFYIRITHEKLNVLSFYLREVVWKENINMYSPIDVLRTEYLHTQDLLRMLQYLDLI